MKVIGWWCRWCSVEGKGETEKRGGGNRVESVRVRRGREERKYKVVMRCAMLICDKFHAQHLIV